MSRPPLVLEQEQGEGTQTEGVSGTRPARDTRSAVCAFAVTRAGAKISISIYLPMYLPMYLPSERPPMAMTLTPWRLGWGSWRSVPARGNLGTPMGPPPDPGTRLEGSAVWVG